MATKPYFFVVVVIFFSLPIFISAASQPSDTYFHARQLLKKSLRISTFILRNLRNIDADRRSDAGALEGCRRLFEANVDLVGSAAEDLRWFKVNAADDDIVRGVRSRLSAALANRRACHDVLAEAESPVLIGNGGDSAAAAVNDALTRSERVYGFALGLVTQALSQSPAPARTFGGGHNRGHHHHHRTESPPSAQRISGGGIQSQSPASDGSQGSPAVEPPPVPSTPERRQSLTDLIKGLKKSAEYCTSSTKTTCSKGRLILQGLQGNGILVSDSLIVSKDGTGDFATIGEAVEAVPENLMPEDGYFVIYSKKGVYEENVDISRFKKNIFLVGDGIDETIITGNRSYADGWSAYNSATFGVAGDGFTAMDVTFRNTYGPGSQAAAVRNQADRSAFFRCSFEGYQDTLYAHSGAQFYRECHVYGTIDFIFGDAAAVFQNSLILGRRPTGEGRVVVTAQGRERPDGNTGTSFHNCTVDAAPDLPAEPGSAFLGRPWKPCSRVVYMQSYLGDVINTRGWSEWDDGSTDGVYYGEYGNRGPGADTTDRVEWSGSVRSEMSQSDALSFTVNSLTDGASWLPDTGIPFTLGLIY